jgi:glycerol uptake facilitator protein
LWWNALHLVRNQSFIIPNYNWWDNFFYAVGLKVYDILVGKLSFVKCIRINKKETISGLKTIKNPQLKGGVVYHNGQFDDARLVINIAQTCIETGAVVLNHFKVEQLINKTIGDNGGWIVVTVGWALGVYVAVVLAGAYSGANVNHAVSIGLAIACEFPWESIPKYILAQMLGAMLVAIIVWLFYKDHFDATKKAVFCTAPAIINLSSNLFNEIVGTVVLVFSVLCFTNASYNDLQSAIGLGFLGALPVAFLVWAIGFSFGGITGHVINPLRNLGPRIIHAMLPIKDKSANDWSHS